MSFSTPILFLIFNRLDTTTQVFNEIRKVKPKKFYIACDGPRQYKEGELEKVQDIRYFILNSIDWECNVKTLFQNNNLGCKEAVSTAISWFFENEEMGIILEDDCLPSQDFFPFCEELLIKYKDDQRIGHIGGTNPIAECEKDNSYYFSVYNRIWGWASWRRAWNLYDKEIKDWPIIKEKKILHNLLRSKQEIDFFTDTLEQCYQGKIDTWDYQWFLARLLNSKAIIPNVNLISNIGFGEDATHTADANNPLANLKLGTLSFPLEHPKYVIQDVQKDSLWSKHLTKNRKNIVRKISQYIKRLLK